MRINTVYLCEGRLECDDSCCSHWSEHTKDSTCTEDTYCELLDREVACVKVSDTTTS